MYHIGVIARFTNRTPFAIREAERTGRIPKAERDARGFRCWQDTDVPAICKGLGVPLPPTLEDRVLDDLLALFRKIAPIIAQRVEELPGGQNIGEAMRELTRS